tara:strand:- start:232 stop:831 length:600 start_codon:yes stop_codon:yes gene_type:complete
MNDEQVIEIKEDDILDNMDYILENSNIFQVNSNMETIKCHIFYYEGKKMLNFKKYEIQISDNTLTKKELLAIVLKHNKVQHKSFDLTGIFKYELNLLDKQIKDFCKSEKDSEYNFITQYHNIQDIEFHPCIQLLNENNSLLLFFSHRNKRSSPTNQEALQQISNKNKTQKKVKFDMEEKKQVKSDKNKTAKVNHSFDSD